MGQGKALKGHLSPRYVTVGLEFFHPFFKIDSIGAQSLLKKCCNRWPLYRRFSRIFDWNLSSVYELVSQR